MNARRLPMYVVRIVSAAADSQTTHETKRRAINFARAMRSRLADKARVEVLEGGVNPVPF